MTLASGSYVLPSYSKIGSQPKNHQNHQHCTTQKTTQKSTSHRNLSVLSPARFCPRMCQSEGLEEWKGVEKNTYIRPALEDNWLVPWSFTICECADGLGRFVWEGGEHVIEPLVTKCF